MSTVLDETPSIEKISDLALNMASEDRSLLLELLHDSLLSPEEKLIQDEWIRIATRRVQEVRSGAVEPIDADVVFDRRRTRHRG